MNKSTQIPGPSAGIDDGGYRKKFANLFGRRKRRRRSQTVYGNTGGSSLGSSIYGNTGGSSPVGSPIFTSGYGYGEYGNVPKGGGSTNY